MLTTSPDTATFRARDRGLRTRQRILNSARHLFSEHGFAATTVREIAHDAGITDAAIYHHFSSKTEMLDILLRSATSGLRRNPAKAGPLRRPQDLPSLIADQALGIIGQHGELYRMITLEALAGDPQAIQRRARWLDHWEMELTDALQAQGLAGPQTAARIIIYTVAMAAEDTFILRRDPGLSRRMRGQRFRETVVCTVNRLLLKDDAHQLARHDEHRDHPARASVQRVPDRPLA